MNSAEVQDFSFGFFKTDKPLFGGTFGKYGTGINLCSIYINTCLALILVMVAFWIPKQIGEVFYI